MADAATWISAVGSLGAAIASAVAAWQSYRSSKAAADEARQMRDQAEVSRKQVAIERMLLAAESLGADERRAIVLNGEIKQAALASMIASGALRSSTNDMAHAAADEWMQEVKGLTAIAIRATSWGSSDLDGMSLATAETTRLEMQRAKERVVVVLEDMERERQSWVQAWNRATRVSDRMAPPGG